MRLVCHTRRCTRHRDPAILNTSASQILFTSLKWWRSTGKSWCSDSPTWT